MLDFSIDPQRCIQCGECAADCPAGIITMDDLPVLGDESRCYRCLHCHAVCPTGALSILGQAGDAPVATPNLPLPEQMRDLITWRRSVRRYAKENVDPALIQTLLDTACHAPTGVNAQGVLFTVVRDRAFMVELRQTIMDRLEQLAAAGNMPDGLAGMYLKYTLEAWQSRGKDIIFRDAPHMVLTSTPPTQACPVQDAHIALTTFELLAATHGLGTLWDGIFMMTLAVFPDLRSILRIPDDHTIGYALLFGRPDVTYHRPAKRGPARITMLG